MKNKLQTLQILSVALCMAMLCACGTAPEIVQQKPTTVILPGKTEPAPGTSFKKAVELSAGPESIATNTISGRVINKDILGNTSNLQLQLKKGAKELATTRTDASGAFTFMGEFPKGKLKVQAAAAGKTWTVELKGNEAREIQLPL